MELGVKDKKRKKENETQQKKGLAQTTIECHGLRNMMDSTLCTEVPGKKGEMGGAEVGAGCPCVLAYAPKWTPNTAEKANDSNSENITLDTVT